MKLRYWANVLLIGLLLAPVQPIAQKSEFRVALEYHQAEALKKRLASHLVELRGRMRPSEFEDTAFPRFAHAFAVAVVTDDKERFLLTSVVATKGVQEMTVRNQKVRRAAPRFRVPPGLVALQCEDGEVLCGARPAKIRTKRCPRLGDFLYFVVREAPGLVLGETVIMQGGLPTSPDGLPPENRTPEPALLPEGLILVRGRLPLGTPLFDKKERLVAVVVRPGMTSEPTALAARLCADEKKSRDDEQKESPAP